MLGWLKKLFARKPKRDIRFVTDNTLNRSNAFWEKHIGLSAEVVRIAPDGLLDVRMWNHPVIIEGVMVERFT